MTNKLVEVAESSARGGFFLFSGNVLSLFILAIGSVLIGRLLGPDAYGLYSLALVVPSILLGLFDFGVNSALTRFSAKLKAEGNGQLVANLLKSGLAFKLSIGIVTSVVCFVFSDVLATFLLNRPELGSLVKLVSILILFQTVCNAFNSSFTGLDRMEGTALIMNVQAILKTTLSPLLVVAGFTVVGALAGHIASYAVATFVGALVFVKYYKALSTSSTVRAFKANISVLLRYGFPLYTSSLLGVIQGQYQTIILAFFVSNAEIGNFSIAVTLSALLNVLLFPLGALFPAFSKVGSDSDELKRIFKMSTKYSALLIIPATVIVVFLAKDIVLTLYGSSYNSAPLFFQFYILSFLLTGFGSVVLGYLFNGAGQTKTVFKYNLIYLIIFLPLSPILTSLYGVVGLIVAFLLCNMFSLVYGLSVAIKNFHVKLDLKASMKIYFASFLSALPIILLTTIFPLNGVPSLVINFPIFLLIYLMLLPVTGAIDQSDIENFQMMFGKIKLAWYILKPIVKFESKLLSFKPWLISQTNNFRR